MTREQGDRQPADRIVGRNEIGPQRQPVPAAVEVHAELDEAAGRTGLSEALDSEAFAQLREQLLGAAAVEVAHDAVVVEDGHLMVRKEHREEVLMRAAARAAGFGDARSGGRAMMSVDRCRAPAGVDRARERGNRRIVADDPQLVAYAVVGGDVHVGRAVARGRKQGVDFRRLPDRPASPARSAH